MRLSVYESCKFCEHWNEESECLALKIKTEPEFCCTKYEKGEVWQIGIHTFDKYQVNQAKELGLTKSMVRERLARLHWRPERAVSEPHKFRRGKRS